MEISNITSPRSTVYAYAPYIGGLSDGGFCIPDEEIDAEEKKALILKDVDPLQVMEEMTGAAVVTKPVGSLTDEAVEYFREKYGNGFTAENMETSSRGISGVGRDENGSTVLLEGINYYGSEQTESLFNELAEKNIISRKDALYASGGCVKAFNIPCNIWELTPEKLREFNKRNAEISRPDFEDGKNYTWDEYMEKRLEVIDRLRKSSEFRYSDEVLDNWQRSLENTRAVLCEIFR